MGGSSELRSDRSRAGSKGEIADDFTPGETLHGGGGRIRTGETELARVQTAVFFVASGNACLHAPHLQTGQSARGGCRDPLERGPRLPAW